MLRVGKKEAHWITSGLKWMKWLTVHLKQIQKVQYLKGQKSTYETIDGSSAGCKYIRYVVLIF